ncbi:hypothetical protein [Chromobacterium haemolyticum]|uniref:hypothetical protein n=1 Tax=Chromobacterium haemolyticum TaxID=394935 RepID=UPI00244B1051|nr:hypothetical protein [Chromobacterium haemolyticum]MDH0342860.1 hypothetical protein [Chromobacterium haemolyticum]
MSENSKNMINVTYEEAVRFFSSVTPNSKCPICEHETFNITGDFDDQGLNQSVLGLMMTSERAKNKLWGRAIIQVECEKCGYLKFHNATTIRTWLNINSPEEYAQKSLSSEGSNE